jgi:hypothetical protein
MSVTILERTVVGSDQFVDAMVRLATLNLLLAVNGVRREFIGPVHPVDACIDVMLIRSTDLKDARYPLIVILLASILATILSFLFFN